MDDEKAIRVNDQGREEVSFEQLISGSQNVQNCKLGMILSEISSIADNVSFRTAFQIGKLQ